ncbi:hypothetical protein BcDW1_5901 [Botrytis cinerea BcDW1]|uniref:Uncharacterized protein n=1 Tax=Botryotinia fuckeliana (strain BcDW1) TaxID=1290391 RepID=M7UFH1_BOTF1|nr:hypothetical protein BcDW1_5901 [Botrytis cinerea BcDW1]
MSPLPTFEHSGGVSVSERTVDKTAAIVMFITGMLLGLSFFVATLRLFDEVIRPRYFPSLPSFRGSTERVTRSSARETPFAEKYGHPQGPGHDLLKEWLPLKKSGLTPASPSVVDWKKLISVNSHKALEDYQRTRFFGFTARELEQIGALADARPGKWDSNSTTEQADLDTVPLHPIFERRHWEREGVVPLHFPKHPYGDGNKFWEIKGNDDIWEALQPALKIATLVLSNIATWQWFDALLNGIYEKIPEDELPAEIKKLDRWRFYPSKSFNHQERTTAFNEVLDQIHSMVTYLSGKLRDTTDTRFDDEPYFMDEAIAETGFSMQASVFGGIDIPLVSGLDLPGKSCGGMFQFNFPSVWFGGVSGGAVLSPSKNQTLWDIRAAYPVPVEWFMGLHDENFWNFYLRAFGPKATHMGPKIVGQWNRRSDQIYVTAPKGIENTTPIDVSSPAPESEMISVHIENKRRRIVKRIMERAQNINPKQPGHYFYSPRVAMEDKARYSGQVCPRYDEIKQYFEDNKTALGLGAMKFTIPSPLLRSYVVRHGGIDLTNPEWTNFFVVANGHKEMFTYSHAGHGMIGLLKDGWKRPEIPIGPTRQPSLVRRVSNKFQPSASTSKRRQPKQPGEILAKVFATLCSATLKNIDPLESTLDYCKISFWKGCNVAWELNRDYLERQGYGVPDMPNGFPEDLKDLDRCIYWSELFDNEAPKGMIRRMRFEAPPVLNPEVRGRKNILKKCVFQSQVAR